MRAAAASHLISDLEERYAGQRIQEEPPKRKGEQPNGPLSGVALQEAGQSGSGKVIGTASKERVEDDGSGEDVDPADLVHESISGKPPPTRRKSIYTPEGETRTQRDERTVFIGNLPIEILKSKVSPSAALKDYLDPYKCFSHCRRHSNDILARSYQITQNLGRISSLFDSDL